MGGELYRGISGGNEVYYQILEYLKKIAEGTGGSQVIEYGTIEGWDWQRIGKTYFYYQDITLTGVAQTVYLPLNRIPMSINRISMIFNSSNARTFSTRIYAHPDVTYYETIDYQAANTSDSRVLNIEHKYVPHKVSWEFSSYTANDIVSLEVQVDVL